MSDVDARGCGISGATPAALKSYERALAAFQGWRGGAETHLELALREAPAFVMAHVLVAYLLLCGRDPRRVHAARPVRVRVADLPTNERERHHLAALDAALADDYDLAKRLLGELLHREPRDALALHAAHALDYLTGDCVRLRDRVAAVLPAWSKDLPGYHTVLGMHAFGLVECDEYERAEQVALEALALNPIDARTHHVMAHVFEMTGRADAGLRWMNEHIASWNAQGVVATHLWWHQALFRLAQGDFDQALTLYDRYVRAGRSGEIADLIDASALLWRIQLRGGNPGTRWEELAVAWAPHIDDRFCSFNDLHAMLAFVGARDWDKAQRLERVLTSSQQQPTRHGETTRLLGLPGARALIAFGRGNHVRAVALLGSLAARARRLGGSRAQRDVLHLTLKQAIVPRSAPVRRSAPGETVSTRPRHAIAGGAPVML